MIDRLVGEDQAEGEAPKIFLKIMYCHVVFSSGMRGRVPLPLMVRKILGGVPHPFRGEGIPPKLANQKTFSPLGVI